MSPKRAHYVNLVCEALKAFNASGLAKTPAVQRKFISTNAVETAEVADDATASFDFGACRSFFDYITARTKVAARVEWVEYVETVEPAGEFEMVRADVAHGEPRMIVSSARERAITEWASMTGFFPDTAVTVAKSRRNKTIAVSYPNGSHRRVFSYEGGTLRAL